MLVRNFGRPKLLVFCPRPHPLCLEPSGAFLLLLTRKEYQLLVVAAEQPRRETQQFNAGMELIRIVFP